ncbi:MerR family transcriptional regulator [Shimia sediminis]|uniref:MerR family transcriptional regulator n=1 Tax=Shimia sediminis TaxID=2497945 RepID=UPI001F19425A|nr:MerR family transcriptional regulator [Shimia sediminis]
MGKSRDAFRTISEVADWLDTQAHVLRFWESKFTQVKPVKRAGGRRYYRPADMRLLGGIKKLLHDDGMTIKGAQKLLREKGVKHVSALSQPLDDEQDEAPLGAAVIEVQPPEAMPVPAEVLEFAPAADAVAATSEDLSDMEGDLFPVKSAEDAAPEAEEVAEDAATASGDPLPGQDELPAFLQRVTFDTVSDDEDDPWEEDVSAAPLENEAAPEEPEPEPVASTEAEDPVAEATEIVEDRAAPSEAPAPESVEETPRAAAPKTDKTSMEPGQSLLPELAATREITAENRAEARALLDRLAALHARVAQSENA